MAGPSHLRGRQAEETARAVLSAAGYRVLESNWRMVGAELDVVCRDDAGIVFAEVRARTAGDIEPSATVDGRKLRRLMRAARSWLARHGLASAPWRFVLVAVTLDAAGLVTTTEIIEEPFIHLPEYHHGDP